MIRLLQGRHLTEHELEQIKRDLSASTARHVTLYLTSQRIISEDSRRLFENALESRNHFLHRFSFYDQGTSASLEGDEQGLYELVNRFEIALRAFEEARAIQEEKRGYDRKELEERIRSYVREEADRYD